MRALLLIIFGTVCFITASERILDAFEKRLVKVLQETPLNVRVITIDSFKF